MSTSSFDRQLLACASALGSARPSRRSLPSDAPFAVHALFAAHPLRAAGWSFAPTDRGDPWPSLAVDVGDVVDATVRWALELGEMLTLALHDDGRRLVVDTFADPDGEHFVFEVTPDGAVGSLRFDRLGAFLAWVTALALHGTLPASPLSPVSRGMVFDPRYARTGMGALPLFLRLSPRVFYQAWRLRRWPDQVPSAPPYEAGRTPTRSAALWTLVTFLRTQRVTVPPGLAPGDQPLALRLLLERLRELEVAIKRDEVPEYIAGLALGDDPAIALAAKDWIARFDDIRRAVVDTGGSEAAEYRAVVDAMTKAVKSLERTGAIELVPKSRVALVEELLSVMSAAHGGDAAVRSGIAVLMGSPHVAEVFADDAVLARALRLALGS